MGGGEDVLGRGDEANGLSHRKRPMAWITVRGQWLGSQDKGLDLLSLMLLQRDFERC